MVMVCVKTPTLNRVEYGTHVRMYSIMMGSDGNGNRAVNSSSGTGNREVQASNKKRTWQTTWLVGIHKVQSYT